MNGEETNQSKNAREALAILADRLAQIIHGLDPYDFEILCDLIFRASGWQLDSVRGGTMKGIDLDLNSPLTGGRSHVQIKSKADHTHFENLVRKYSGKGLEHVYLVVHTLEGKISEESREGEVEVLGPERLARLAARLGLGEWIVHKAA